MALTALTERQKQLIVTNVVKAVNNIDSLNNTGYKFLCLASGFIAHYDRQGFIAEYSERSLRQDLVSYAGSNQFRNFRPGEANYDYYMSKADVYNQILSQIL
jgi:hypothetical protein